MMDIYFGIVSGGLIVYGLIQRSNHNVEDAYFALGLGLISAVVLIVGVSLK